MTQLCASPTGLALQQKPYDRMSKATPMTEKMMRLMWFIFGTSIYGCGASRGEARRI